MTARRARSMDAYEDEDDGDDSAFSVASLLSAARPSSTAPEQETPENMQLDLRGYQKRALAWMVAKEDGSFDAAFAGASYLVS